MAVFFISDTHFGHGNILKYCHRPFLNEEEQRLLSEHHDFKVCRESVEKMDNTIIDNINKVVKSDDTLWHLGDFAFADYSKAKRYRDRINCQNMYLVWGNHDKPYIRDLFNDCYAQGGGGRGSDPPEAMTVDGQWIWLNHYPMLSWEGSYKGCWVLHGHVHGNIRKHPAWRAVYDLMQQCDVGVDGPCMSTRDGVWNHTFKPWTMAELRKFMEPKVSASRANRTL